MKSRKKPNLPMTLTYFYHESRADPLTHTGMGFVLVVMDIAHDPIAIGLLGAVGIVVIPQDLANLIHEQEFRIGAEVFGISHAINTIMQ